MFQSFLKCVGYKTILLNSQQYCYRLGKQCKNCKQIIVHRQAISVCNCYQFSHRKCFSKMILQQPLTEFTRLKCQNCQYILGVELSADYVLNPIFTLKKIILTLSALVLLILSCIALFIVQSNKQKENKIDQISEYQVTIIALTTIFAAIFWISVMNILFRKVIQIVQIKPTNIEIKISAFESIQDQLKQDSQQEIFIKAPL